MVRSEGWVCPVCGRGLSPWMSDCPCYPPKPYISTGTGGISSRQTYTILPQELESSENKLHPKGEWIAVSKISASGFGTWACSECNRYVRGKKENLPFCNCGADMRGKDS